MLSFIFVCMVRLKGIKRSVVIERLTNQDKEKTFAKSIPKIRVRALNIQGLYRNCGSNIRSETNV